MVGLLMTRKNHWRVAHASVTGTRHSGAGQECQDFSCFLRMPKLHPDALVACVADGLGSAKHGALAAQLAAETACLEASTLLWERQEAAKNPERIESLLNASILQARLVLEHQAEAMQEELTTLGTTLLIIVHVADTIAAAQVGDGAAVVSTQHGNYITLAQPQRGEYANETTALTSKRALQKCQLTIAQPPDPVQEIAMLTDGLLNISMDTSSMEPHQPFFAKLTNWLREYPDDEHPGLDLEDTLKSDFITKRTDDDLTLLLAVRAHNP